MFININCYKGDDNKLTPSNGDRVVIVNLICIIMSLLKIHYLKTGIIFLPIIILS